LGIGICRSCGADILPRNGLPSSPERQGLAWQQVLARHTGVLLCADFSTEEVWAFTGLKTACVLFVIRLSARRIILVESTFCSDKSWMSQVACDANRAAAAFTCPRTHGR